MFLNVVFRTDASVTIGSGHVMRCLTLADAITKANGKVHFLCRRLDGHLETVIQNRGYPVTMLTTPHMPSSRDASDWLQVSQTQDAEETESALRQISDDRPDWIIVDHYALDAEWHSALQHYSKRIMALDDLANRPMAVDLLVDPTLGRIEDDYLGLLPKGTPSLTGPNYALLQPRFAALRSQSLKRRSTQPARRLMITMGGVDKNNQTGSIVEALNRYQPQEVEVLDVVLGRNAPHIDQVRDQLSRLSIPAQLHVETPLMAELMAAADVAIGAGGGTSWERCCLGLPTIVVAIAQNQMQIARALHDAGAAITVYLEDETDFACQLMSALRTLSRKETRGAMSLRAAAICDGQGSNRVLEAMYRTFDRFAQKPNQVF